MCMMLPIGIKFLGIQLSSSFITNVLTVYSGSMLGLSIAANVMLFKRYICFLLGFIRAYLILCGVLYLSTFLKEDIQIVKLS